MTATPGAAATFCATLVDEWIRLGVRTAILCPGSRSTPLAVALASRQELSLHVFHDERSAAFAALGAALASGSPAVLACTSGTAAVNFHPAVVEADHARVPMIVCTADRPPELQGVGAPQTIEQHGLFGGSVRWEHDPGVPDGDAADSWRGVAARAHGASLGPVPGPVHLNLPFREPLLGQAGALPPPLRDRPSPRPLPDDGDLAALMDVSTTGRGVILAGWGVDDPAAVTALAARTGWPVIADPRSGIRDRGDSVVVRHADPILRHVPTAARLRPDVVLRLGDPPASKVVNAWLASSGARVVAVSPVGRIVDPDRIVERQVVVPTSTACAAIRGAVPADAAWSAEWAAASRAATTALDAALDATVGLSEPLVARLVARGLDGGALLMVSSSMPVRDLEWFGGEVTASRTLANRGTNGIDGVTSTAIGAALASGSTVVLVTGDVAFLHDSSALAGLAGRAADVRIVVVDNGGGGIFSFLPQATALEPGTFERLFGTPHSTDLVALARAHGIRAYDAADRGQFAAALAGPGPSVVRVRTDRAANVAEHDRLNAAVAAALA